MRAGALTTALAVALAIACGKDSPRATDKRVPEKSVLGEASAPARVWPADAPSRDAGCQRHEDCTVAVWDGPFPPDPCCDARVGYLPVRVAYLSWMKDYRARSCAGVSCPTPPLPGAEPACCAGHARCVKNTCISACDDPSAGLPQVSVLDPSCSQPPPPPPPP